MVKNKKLSFEERIKRLEEIQEKMDSGNLSLEENNTFFNESLVHIKHCKQLLDSAQIQVKKIENRKEVDFN